MKRERENEIFQVLSENFYHALLRQNTEELKHAIGEARKPIRIDGELSTLALGGLMDHILIPASLRLLKEGHASAVEFSLDNVEDVSHVPYYRNKLICEAAFYNYPTLIEKLRALGAEIAFIARGVARRGDRDCTEEFIFQGVELDAVASGAAEGGYFDHADELINRGAYISTVACAAVYYGHFKYVNALIERGANIELVCTAAFNAGYDDYIKELQMRIFISFQTSDLNEIARRLFRSTNGNYYYLRVPVEISTIKRAAKIVSLQMNNPGLQLRECFAITDKENFGALFQLVAVTAFVNSKFRLKTGMPPEILLNILSFNFGFENYHCVFKTAGFGLFLSKIMPRSEMAVPGAPFVPFV